MYIFNTSNAIARDNHIHFVFCIQTDATRHHLSHGGLCLFYWLCLFALVIYHCSTQKRTRKNFWKRKKWLELKSRRTLIIKFINCRIRCFTATPKTLLYITFVNLCTSISHRNSFMLVWTPPGLVVVSMTISRITILSIIQELYDKEINGYGLVSLPTVWIFSRCAQVIFILCIIVIITDIMILFISVDATARIVVVVDEINKQYLAVCIINHFL